MKFEKYRELRVDPLGIRFSRINIDKIINYPHAGNDVIECIGSVDGKTSDFFIKFERHSDANFDNEVFFLEKLQQWGIKVPRVIEFGSHEQIKYLVLEKIAGARLSLLLDSYKQNTKTYCNTFGESIGLIHTLPFVDHPVGERRFHGLAKVKHENTFVTAINDWLVENKPLTINRVFIHGDHHYANLLWDEKTISGVLDWELAGLGNKEFDLAWAIVLRPSQRFFTTKFEEEEILNGYCKMTNFDHQAYSYYKVQIMSHFSLFSDNEPEYKEWIIQNVNEIISRNA